MWANLNELPLTEDQPLTSQLPLFGTLIWWGLFGAWLGQLPIRIDWGVIMTISRPAALRWPLSFRRCGLLGCRPGHWLTACVLALGLTPMSPTIGNSQASSDEIVVRDDLGGFIWQRLVELSRIEAAGQSVRIDRGACYSTCTLYLGLTNICTTPHVTFGFHGPWAMNRQLSPEDFEELSGIIASHYPQPLRAWYLETGRYKANGLYRIKGSELIRLGVAAC